MTLQDIRKKVFAVQQAIAYAPVMGVDIDGTDSFGLEDIKELLEIIDEGVAWETYARWLEGILLAIGHTNEIVDAVLLAKNALDEGGPNSNNEWLKKVTDE